MAGKNKQGRSGSRGWLAPEALLGMESDRGIEVELPQVVRMRVRPVGEKE